MPFTTTIGSAFEHADNITINGIELDGGEAGSWDYQGSNIRVELDDAGQVLIFPTSLEIEISDAGIANVTDDDEDEHEIVFECRRPLVESDCQN